MWVMVLIMVFPVLGVALFLVLPWEKAIPFYGVGLVASLVCHWAMAASGRVPVKTGIPGMLGQEAIVLAWSSGRGTVRYHGELWRARAPRCQSPPPGTCVEIVAVEHMELLVTSKVRSDSR